MRAGSAFGYQLPSARTSLLFAEFRQPRACRPDRSKRRTERARRAGQENLPAGKRTHLVWQPKVLPSRVIWQTPTATRRPRADAASGTRLRPPADERQGRRVRNALDPVLADRLAMICRIERRGASSASAGVSRELLSQPPQKRRLCSKRAQGRRITFQPTEYTFDRLTRTRRPVPSWRAVAPLRTASRPVEHGSVPRRSPTPVHVAQQKETDPLGKRLQDLTGCRDRSRLHAPPLCVQLGPMEFTRSSRRSAARSRCSTLTAPPRA